MSAADNEEVPDGFYHFIDDNPEVDRVIETYEQDGDHIRLVACYGDSLQEWHLRKQVMRDGEWRTSGWGVGLDRNGPDDHPDRVRYMKNRYVARENGMFSDLPLRWRIIGAPIYGLWFALSCLRGDDVNVQTLHDPEWEPDE